MWQHSFVRELTDLKTAGYLVSVDDFGTGYSNLSSIKKLLPDFLKIDKSFVFDMEENSLRSSLIPEIVGIARAVGAKVIAEGIENEAQWRMLLSFGVEYGQGYWFARPMQLAQFAAYLGSICPCPD
jgi:EAL domain-containing protein (putative c-di-GMP-specific phosphodiesterase class I)